MKTKISDLVYKIHYLSVTFSLSVLILFFPHGFLSSALLTSPTHTSFLLGPISLQFLRSQLKEVFSAHILCQNSYLSLPLGSKLQQGRIVYLLSTYQIPQKHRRDVPLALTLMYSSQMRGQRPVNILLCYVVFLKYQGEADEGESNSGFGKVFGYLS